MTDSYELTLSTSEPFFTGLEATTTIDRSLPVSVGSRSFNLDLLSNQFSRRSVELLNTQQASGSGDTASLAPEVWRRVAESWHAGSGQDRADREDSNPNRFSKSSGVDPWTKYEVSLLNKTEQLTPLAAAQGAMLRSIGETLFVILDDEVQVYADAINLTSHTDEAFADPPIGAACDGEVLYVLDDAGVIHSYTVATTTWNHAVATVASFAPTKAMIAFVKGFLLVGNGPDLWDYTAPATPSLIMTHRLDGWWWRAACEGQTVSYVLGGMGDRWHVLRMNIKTTGAGLDPPIVAATLPEGEFAYTVSSYLGYVLIGVNTGWRFALADGSGSLTYGRVIRTPRPVTCFEGQDRFVWFGLSIEDGDEESEYLSSSWAGLGRADLSIFVDPATPGYASDLFARFVNGVTTDVVTVGSETDGLGRRVFAVKSDLDGGVYIEKPEKVEEGWIRQGAATFNSTDKKMGLYGQVFHAELRGTITADVSVDDGALTGIGSNSNAGSTSMGNMAFTEPFNTIDLRITMERDASDLTLGPTLRRSEFRAVNIPGRATEWRIPLLVTEDNYGGDSTFTRNVGTDYDYLVGLVQSREQFTYREGDRTWLLHARDFLWQPTHLVSDGSTYQGTFILVAREIN